VVCAALASEESVAGEDPLPTAKLGATSGVVWGGCCASRTEILDGPLSSATVAGVGTGLLVCGAAWVLLEFLDCSGFFVSARSIRSAAAGLLADEVEDEGCAAELSAVVVVEG